MEGFNPTSFSTFSPAFSNAPAKSQVFPQATFKPVFPSNPGSQNSFSSSSGSFGPKQTSLKFTPNFSAAEPQNRFSQSFQGFPQNNNPNKSLFRTGSGSFNSQESEGFRVPGMRSFDRREEERQGFDKGKQFRGENNERGQKPGRDSSNQGHHWNRGVQGAQGFQGLQRTQGTQGFQGFQGFQAAQDFQASQGTRGAQGKFQGFVQPNERSSSKSLETSKNSDKNFEKLRKINKNEFQEDFDETEKKLRQKALATFKAIKSKRLPESKLINLNPRNSRVAPEANSEKSQSKMRSWPEQTEKPVQIKAKSDLQSPRPASLVSTSWHQPKTTTPKPEARNEVKPKAKAVEVLERQSSSLYKMCSQEESLSRQESKQLNIFERFPGTDQCNPEWTIKKYLRSSADREEDQRTAEDLSSTLHYLITEILDVDSNGNPNAYDFQQDHDCHSYQDIYPFLFDRMRAVVKDWKMLKSNETDDYVKDHEIIARFLIMSCVEGLVCESFNLNLNLKLTEDVLTCLVRAYEKRRKQGLPCDNQAEFLCYFIITKPENKLQILPMLKGLPKDLLQSKYIQLAIYLFTCYHNDDYEEFFNTVYDAPYLVACAAYPLFHRIRVYIMDLLVHQSVEKLTLELFMQLFAFYDEEEAKTYIQEFGLGLASHKDPQQAIVSFEKVLEKIRNQNFSVIPAVIQEKNQSKTRLEVISCSEIFEDQEKCEDEEEKTENQEFLEEKTEKKEVAVFNEKKIVSAEKVEVLAEKNTESTEKTEPKESFNKPEPTKLDLIESNRPKFQPSLFVPAPSKPVEKTETVSKLFNQRPAPTEAKEPKIQTAPKKVPKRLTFEFPFDDKQILSVVKEKSQKEKIKENIRNYRSEKKLREKAKKRQMESLMKLKVFNGWKSLALKAKVQKFFENRKSQEMEIFKEQFSCLVISDNLNFQRFLMIDNDLR